MKQLIVVFCIWTLASCNSSSSTNNQTKKGFANSDSFKVLSIERTTDYPSSETDTMICSGWTLTDAQIVSIIRGSRIITGPEWHHLFEHLPCSISGQLEQNELTFDFSINGGSWLVISRGDSTSRYGDFDNTHETLFISHPGENGTEERHGC